MNDDDPGPVNGLESGTDEGLRARKRRASMRRIQDAALDLFDEHGYDAVTIERIATAADVSPSSVYRYFGTKEGIVLYDPNATAITLSRSAGEPAMETFRVLITSVLADRGTGDDVVDRRRVRLVMEVPAVQAAVGRRLFDDVPALSALTAERLGRPSDDLEVQVIWTALYGALIGAVRHWHAHDYAEPLDELIERTFAALRRGFDLG